MRANPSGQSSKADLVESLLRLGDIARNNQVGEVQTALGKAKLLMEKYGLMQFDGRYQQLVEKLAAFLRGEKVHATQEEPKQHQQSSDDPFRRYRTYREQADARKKARRDAKKAERQQRTASRRAEKKAAKAEARRNYVRPSRNAAIIWLWHLSAIAPRRGKAGERWKAYYKTTTIEKMLAKGGKWSDVRKNILHGYMKVEEV